MESQKSCDDSVTMNNGSVVGLPTSSSDDEDSTDELTRAGDALCRSLLQEQASIAIDDRSTKKISDDEAEEEEEVAVDFQSDGNLSDKLKQPNLEVDTKNTDPSPCTSDESGETSASSSDGNHQQALEERVQELETKLATLSRILQQQQRLSVRSLLALSPSNSQSNLLQNQAQKSALTPRLPAMPAMEELQYEKGSTYNNTKYNSDDDNNNNPHNITDSPPSRMTQTGRIPYLESPAPIAESPHRRSGHQRKRLSFHLLYDGNEENLALADDDSAANVEGMESASSNKDTTEPANMHLADHSNQESVKDDTVHPLHNNSSHGSDRSNTSGPTQSTDQENNTASGTLADVATRIVDAQTKSSTGSGAKETNLMESSNHSNSLDVSQTKQQSRTSSSSSGTSAPNEESSSAVASPGHRIRAAILPPILLSTDKRSKLLDHLNSFQESNHDVDRQMQEFIKVPGAVESCLASGLLICVDSFLYVWTILPIRFAWSCVLLSLHYFFKWTKKPPGNYQFHRRHTYQLIQVSIILLIYRYLLIPISIGKVYHWIRGQAMIKLYVVIAMVEVFDRLMCSLGQDCLDSLYWNTTRRPRSSRMLISVSVVVVYTAVHSLVLFVHVATLNVAMNSADEALLALLIGGNFAEIKSTVFKKYNKPSLFKIVASDICERFKLALFLGLVLLLNFCQGMDSRKMSDYQRIAGIVWMSELFCDWLKHSFITKFNFIPSSVYTEYSLLLAGDVTGIGHEGVNLDHSHAVVKRIGFAQMPLVCVMARLVREAAKYMSLRIDDHDVPSFIVVLAGLGSWMLLLLLKTLLGAYLQRTSLAKLHAAPELSQTPLKHKKE